MSTTISGLKGWLLGLTLFNAVAAGYFYFADSLSAYLAILLLLVSMALFIILVVLFVRRSRHAAVSAGMITCLLINIPCFTRMSSEVDFWGKEYNVRQPYENGRVVYSSIQPLFVSLPSLFFEREKPFSRTPIKLYSTRNILGGAYSSLQIGSTLMAITMVLLLLVGHRNKSSEVNERAAKKKKAFACLLIGGILMSVIRLGQSVETEPNYLVEIGSVYGSFALWTLLLYYGQLIQTKLSRFVSYATIVSFMVAFPVTAITSRPFVVQEGCSMDGCKFFYATEKPLVSGIGNLAKYIGLATTERFSGCNERRNWNNFNRHDCTSLRYSEVCIIIFSIFSMLFFGVTVHYLINKMPIR